MTTESPSLLDYHVVGRRIVAAIIDGIVIGIGFAVLTGTFGDVDTGGNSDIRFHLGGGPFAFYVIASLIYFTLMESQLGATLGKMVMSIKVVRRDGTRCGVVEALVRNVLRVVDAFPAFYLLGMLVIAVTPNNQRIGDLAASTLVVSASVAVAPRSSQQDAGQQLRELAKLHEEGLVTDEEFEEKRRGLIEKL